MATKKKNNIITNFTFQEELCKKVDKCATFVEKDDDFTVLASDAYKIHVVTQSGDVTATLPPAADVTGKTFRFHYTAGSDDFVLDGNGAETIDGATTETNTGTGYIEIVSTGAAWIIV